MAKVAKLIMFTITTRVIVEENDPEDEQAIKQGRANILGA